LFIWAFFETPVLSTFQGIKKDDWRIVSVLSSFYGIVQQNEYNPFGNIAWVHSGAIFELGCKFTQRTGEIA